MQEGSREGSRGRNAISCTAAMQEKKERKYVRLEVLERKKGVGKGSREGRTISRIPVLLLHPATVAPQSTVHGARGAQCPIAVKTLSCNRIRQNRE